MSNVLEHSRKCSNVKKFLNKNLHGFQPPSEIPYLHNVGKGKLYPPPSIPAQRNYCTFTSPVPVHFSYQFSFLRSICVTGLSIAGQLRYAGLQVFPIGKTDLIFLVKEEGLRSLVRKHRKDSFKLALP